MEKHSHYQEQLELSHQKLRHVESLGDKEHIKRNQEKYDTLAEKTREMGYKVRRDNPKLHAFTPQRCCLNVDCLPAVETNTVAK